jgi:hypothetical protein
MYNITKGQLITAMVGSAILWIVCLINADSYPPAWWGQIGSVLIPFASIFYFIGWRKKNHSGGEKSTEKFIDLGVSSLKTVSDVFKKHYLKILAIFLIIAAINLVNDYQRVASYQKEKQDEYVGSRMRGAKIYENAQSCSAKRVEAQLPELVKKCKAEYADAFANYQDCKRNMSWMSHHECITWPGANYEKIDCSEATLTKQIKDTDFVCFTQVKTELENISFYEQMLVQDYLNSLPKSTHSLTSEQLEEIYSQIPSEVLDEKTKTRINTIIQEKGYILPNQN